MIPGGRLPVQFANAGSKILSKASPPTGSALIWEQRAGHLCLSFLKHVGQNLTLLTCLWIGYLTTCTVEPVNVLDVLQDFEDSSPENKAVAEQLKSNVNCSGWKCIPCLLI